MKAVEFLRVRNRGFGINLPRFNFYYILNTSVGQIMECLSAFFCKIGIDNPVGSGKKKLL